MQIQFSHMYAFFFIKPDLVCQETSRLVLGKSRHQIFRRDTEQDNVHVELVNTRSVGEQ